MIGFTPAVIAASNGFSAQTLTLTPGINTSEVRMTWYGDTSDGNISVVKLAPRADVIGGIFPNNAKIVAGTSITASEGKISHRATVTGLTPNTDYVYMVSCDGVTFSKLYSYRTPASDSFTFAVTGDPQLTVGLQDSSSSRAEQSTLQGWYDTINAIASKGVDFIAGVGDQVDITNNGSEDEYTNFFAPAALRRIPFAPAIGNHDRHYLFNYHYNIPNEQRFSTIETANNATNQQYKDMEVAGNYYYLYNNALFVVLNDSGYPESKEVAAQFVHNFDATLRAATAAHAGQYIWLFVQHHKSTQSVADHLADRDIQYYVEAGFEALMDKYNVDLVFAGHDHVYARSFPLRNGITAVSTIPSAANTLISGGNGNHSVINPQGTIYFTTTTASGLKYYELFNNAGNLYVKDNEFYPYLVNELVGSAEYMKGNLPYTTARYLQSKTPGYLFVRVSSNAVTVEFYDLDEYCDIPFDSYTIIKIN